MNDDARTGGGRLRVIEVRADGTSRVWSPDDPNLVRTSDPGGLLGLKLGLCGPPGTNRWRQVLPPEEKE